MMIKKFESFGGEFKQDVVHVFRIVSMPDDKENFDWGMRDARPGELVNGDWKAGNRKIKNSDKVIGIYSSDQLFTDMTMLEVLEWKLDGWEIKNTSPVIAQAVSMGIVIELIELDMVMTERGVEPNLGV